MTGYAARVWDGSAWQPVGTQLADLSSYATNTTWTTYTPTFTWGTTATTVLGRYTQIGKTVHFEASATITSIGTPSGVPTMSIPVTCKNSFYGGGVMRAWLLDAGSNLWTAFPSLSSSSCGIYLIGTGGLISATPTSSTPFTWTTTDAFYVAGTYEVAA